MNLAHSLALLLLPVLASTASAQNCKSEQTVFYASTSFFNGFGTSLALEGDTLVVGKPIHSLGQVLGAPGAVFVHERADVSSPWVRTEVLLPSTEILEGFGMSVSLDGPLLAVGAPDARHSNSTVSGLVYLFERVAGAFVLRELIEPEVPLSNGEFGAVVSLVGDRLLVGAPGSSVESGVHIYSLAGGAASLEQSLLGADHGLAATTRFGGILSANDHYAVVASDFDTKGIFAYALSPSGASFLGKLSGSAFSLTGSSMALSGSRVAAAQRGTGSTMSWVAAGVWDLENLGAAPTTVSGTTSLGLPSAQVALDAEHLVLRSTAAGFGEDIVRRYDLDSLESAPPLEVQLCPDSASGQVLLDDSRILVGDPYGVLGTVRCIEELADGSLFERDIVRLIPDLTKEVTVSVTIGSNFGPDMAGQLCWFLGSVTGTSPGVQLPAGLVPLNADAYTLAIINNPMGGPVFNSLQPLNEDGRAWAPLNFDAGIDHVPTGLVVSHSAIVLDVVTSEVIRTGNAISGHVLD